MGVGVDPAGNDELSCRVVDHLCLVRDEVGPDLGDTTVIAQPYVCLPVTAGVDDAATADQHAGAADQHAGIPQGDPVAPVMVARTCPYRRAAESR